MNDVQKAGGVAALVGALAYLIGFALFILFLDSSAYVGPLRKVAFLVENQSALYAGIMVTYVVTGIALVALASALHERLKNGSAAMMQVATPLGFIWAGLIMASGMIFIVGMETVVGLFGRDPDRAASLWLAVTVVQNGLGGGVEIVGGLWVLLVSLAAQQASALPRWLNYLGMTVGTAGVLTVVPAFGKAADMFGLGMIIWFASVGIVMLRAGRRDASSTSAPQSA